MALQMDTARISAARAGDPAALDAVVTEYLPLVYNIVRRSLRHSADVDDVVQETMLQLVRGVGSLRDPERLRAWLVAITVNQIRDHQRSAIREPGPFDDRMEVPDPGADFVGHTLMQLDLSLQRRETHQAADWLDPEHRELLALWWLEASGQLTRPELVDALQADPHQVAVRVNRMKEQLDAARRIVRVLALAPRCRSLDELAYDWDGSATSVWRKRLARHVRECHHCTAANRDLIAPERLLAGLALLPIPAAYAGFRASSLFIEVERPKVRARHGAHRGGKATGMAAAKPLGLAFAAIAVVAVGAIVVEGMSPKQSTVAITTTATGSALASTAQATRSVMAIPTVSASPSASPTTAKPTVARTSAAPRTSSAPRTSAAAVVTSSSTSAGSNSETAAQQVLDVINKARAQNGLKPYTMSTDLIDSAGAHNTRMENGCGLSHQCSGEAALGDRETAAGVQWTSAGENIGEGGPVSDTQSSIASMAVGLTNSMLAEQPPDDGHRLNILSSSYTEVGIVVTRDSSGTVWMTQDFAGDG
ncbi:MAG TPA: sigma-70 family RNA polymerase sigma factor [Actinospica sp.]|nr:sigma-70 family RNA polymerase sigma factor [Actinospica sp.]